MKFLKKSSFTKKKEGCFQDKMTKTITDKLIEIFLWIWLFIFCSLALKVGLGLIWLISGAVSEFTGDIYFWFGDLSWSIQVAVSVIVGLFIMFIVNEYYIKKKRQNERKN